MRNDHTDEERAFAELLRESRGPMYSAAMAVLGNEQDALDAMQEATLRAWRKLPSLRERAYFMTWITRITIRCAVDIARKRKPQAQIPRELSAPREHVSERLDIRRAVDALDEKTRLCAMLFYYEDMPVDRIAGALGIRAGTVKSRLHRARAKLRAVLEVYDEQ